ncbi:MAG TPA: flagellar biosynthesis protein FlhB [Ruminococcaceae bacterium]|nr:flagellar biosynthesis protein FlhB [Oscillospiraceae bacterium]
MASSSSSESKTEKATPKKRKDERKKGNIFQSADVVSALSVLAVFIVIKLTLPYVYSSLSDFFSYCFGRIGTDSSFGSTETYEYCLKALTVAMLGSLPAAATAVLAAFLTTGAQTKFKFSREKIKFKLSNINPLQGIKRLFSLRSVVELLKSIIKIVIIGYIIYIQIKKICAQCVNMIDSDIKSSTLVMLNDIMDLVIQISIVFIALAAADYLYQWWDYERNIRMTKQELKEEYKELEGNPEIKGRIRQVQRQMAHRRMMQSVPTADVVVRNPTHYAIALRYNPEKDGAPVVVAKGKDYVALKIIEIAGNCGIPMREDRPLAHALYAAVKVDMEIPPEFYNALAEILAWVYRLKKEAR